MLQDTVQALSAAVKEGVPWPGVQKLLAGHSLTLATTQDVLRADETLVKPTKPMLAQATKAAKRPTYTFRVRRREWQRRNWHITKRPSAGEPYFTLDRYSWHSVHTSFVGWRFLLLFWQVCT